MRFNKERAVQYFEKLYKEILKLQFKNSHKQNITFLLAKIEEDPNMSNIQVISYVLATCLHETAFTLDPINEKGEKSYFNKYEPNTQIGKNLGNTQKGDGFAFRGKGFVQITGRANYKKMSSYVGYDLITNPQLALNKDVAYQILVVGMTKGLFTGKKLSDYINKKETNYRLARRVVNGNDKADKIAYYAQCIETILKVSVVKESVLYADSGESGEEKDFLVADTQTGSGTTTTEITATTIDNNQTVLVTKTEASPTGGIQSWKTAITGVLSSVGVSIAGIWSWLSGKLSAISQNVILWAVVLCVLSATTLIITHLILKYKEKMRREAFANELTIKQLEIHADPDRHNVVIR